MDFLLLSDLHATDRIPVGRLDDVAQTFDYKFSFVLNYAKNHDCIILQAGDLFDKSRNWALLDYFMRRLKEYNVPLYGVFGQHDLYNRADPDITPTALLTLMRAGLVHPLSAEPEMIRDVCICGASWKEKIPEPGIASKNILVLHAPIALKEEYPEHDYTHPRHFLKKHHMFDLILVGDVHRHFIVKKGNQVIVNTGPMLRLESTEYNFKHQPCFYVWNSDNFRIKKIVIPHQKAEDVLTREHLEIKKLSKQELDSFAEDLRNMKPLSDMRKRRIKKHLQEHISDKLVKRLVEEIIDGY